MATQRTCVVAAYNDVVTANIARARLEEDGIRAVLEDDGIVSTAPLEAIAYGGVKVRVAESDEHVARQILKEFDDKGVDVDWSSVGFEDNLEEAEFAVGTGPDTLVCPECGSAHVHLGMNGQAMIGLVALLWVVPYIVESTTEWGSLLGTYGAQLRVFVTLLGVVMLLMRAFNMRCTQCGHEARRGEFDPRRHA